MRFRSLTLTIRHTRSTVVLNRHDRPFYRRLLTRAIDSGPSEPPLLEQTVPQHFASIVSAYGDRNAVISRHQGRVLSYDRLDMDSNAVARGLEKLGVERGDRVAVSLGNSTEFATITYALFKLGAILVPLNPAFTAPQIISALNHLSAAHLVISAETGLPWKPPRSNIPLLSEIIPNLNGSYLESEHVPTLRNLVVVDNSSGRVDLKSMRSSTTWTDVMEDGESGGALTERVLYPDDIVNIQFTSGTTSSPKAACLTHRGILNNGKSIGDRLLLTENDIVCCPPPLYHCFGCILGYMATATHGSAIVFSSEAFNPKATLQAVQEYGCTALYGVPTMFLAELELLSSGEVGSSGFQHLRTGIASGTSVPKQLMQRLHEVVNLTELTICYGMTETSPVSCMTTTDDPMRKRLETVGRLLPHVRAKIVAADDRTRILGIKEKGELAVAGYNVMKGYWGDKKRTDEALIKDEEGTIWMHTGDEAEMDAEGYVSITGRLKDIIIRGGENIHPLDIENCLIANDSIADASVCGVPDEQYGEAVAVFVVKRAGKVEVQEDEVRKWVRERLGGHFVPKHVFWIVDFPKTASGKIQRFKLEEMAMESIKKAEAASPRR